MKKLKQKINFLIKEAVKKQFDTYFSSYSAAVQHAREVAMSRGFTITDDDWFTYVNMGPKKPIPGETTPLVRIPLYNSRGELTNKELNYRVYGMDGGSGQYELTAYIS